MLKNLLQSQQLLCAKAAPGRLVRLLSVGLGLLLTQQAQAQTANALTGAYTINNTLPTAGTNFTSFSDAATRLNTDGVSGPVTITVSNGPYVEQFLLGDVAGTSATNTLTVNGAGRVIRFAPTVTGQRAVVLLNGTDYTTINNLVIDATGGGPSGTYGYGVQLTNAADNDRITNNTVNTDATSTSLNFAGIVVSGSLTSATTTGNSANNLTIEGNDIIGGYYGISLYGNSATGALNTGNIVRNNQVHDFYLYGVYVAYQAGTQVVGNDIHRAGRTNGSTFYGIYASGLSQGLAIEKNRIHDTFAGNPASTSSLYAIYLTTGTGATAAAPNDVVNNAFYNLSGSGLQYLIYNIGAAYSRIYNNTINSDDQTTTSTSTLYGIYSSGTNSDVRNNVVNITRTGTGTKYGLYYVTNAPTSNNNDIYIPGGSVGYYTSAYATLANWQTANGSTFDQNSVSTDPLFVPAGVPSGSLVPRNALLNSTGAPLARVTDDITGAVRGATPDMGAFEFTPLAFDVFPSALLGPGASTVCYSPAEPVIVQLSNNGGNTLNFATTPATVTVVVTPPTGAAQTFTTTVNTGTLASAATLPVTLPGTLNMTAPGTYSFAVTATVPGDLNTSNDVLAPAVSRTVTAPVAGAISPAASELCISGTATLNLVGSANGAIQWQESTNGTTFTDIAGATTDALVTPVLTTTRYYRARVGCNATTATSNVATITVNNPQVLTASTAVTVCAGSPATLTATAATGTTLSYFSAATGGTALGTGPSFTTPALTTATQYFVEASIGQMTTVGATNNTIGAAGTANLTYGLIFSVSSPTTLTGVYVYPGAAGTARIEYQNSAATVIQAVTATITAANVGQRTFIPLGFALQAGTGFRLMLITATGGATLSRNTAGASYPYVSGNGNVSITGNTFTGYPQYYYYFYDWQIGGECVAATRTPIQVNITPAPATPTLTATAQPNGAVLLTASAVTGATYQFYRGGVAVGTPSTSATLLLQSGTLNGSYTVAIISGGCTSAQSTAVAVTVTGTRTSTLNGVSLLVYPNPTPDGRLTLELTGSQAKASALTVVNSLGQVVHARTIAPGTATLSLADLAAGVYNLRVQTPDGVLTQRIVRE